MAERRKIGVGGQEWVVNSGKRVVNPIEGGMGARAKDAGTTLTGCADASNWVECLLRVHR